MRVQGIYNCDTFLETGLVEQELMCAANQEYVIYNVINRLRESIPIIVVV